MPPFVLLLGAVLLVGFLPSSAAASAVDRSTVAREAAARALPLPGGVADDRGHDDEPAADGLAPGGRPAGAAATSRQPRRGAGPACGRDQELRRAAVDPYGVLRSWERDGSGSPARAVRGWKRTHGCPQAP